jgi:hypothetical protein
MRHGDDIAVVTAGGVGERISWHEPPALLDAFPWLALAGLLWPLLVWRGEAWGRRDYFWSLPVRRTTHELTRVAAGAMWLVVAAASCAVLSLAMVHLHGAHTVYIGSGWQRYHVHYWPGALFWTSFLVGPLIPYTLASAFPLALKRPLEWLVAAACALAFLMAIGVGFRLQWLSEPLSSIVNGALGLRTALGGGAWSEWLDFLSDVGAAGFFSPFTASRWAWSTVLWLGLGVAAVLVATRRRR